MNTKSIKKYIPLMLFCIGIGFFCTAYTTFNAAGPVDYYVSPSGNDENPGTKKQPFKTISKAASVIAPGGTVHVAPGTYAENILTKASGTESARIRFVSDKKWGAKIVPPPGNKAKTGFDNRGHYVTIDGFEVDGTQATGTLWTVGINIAGKGDIVQNCKVYNIYTTVNGGSGGGAGILLDSWYGFNDMQAIGNIVYNIGPKPPLTGGRFYQGIYQTATGSIKNNITYGVSGAGIHLWHNDHHIDIVNNTTFGNDIGIVWGGGDYINGTGKPVWRGPASHINIYNNIVYDNTSYGLNEAGQNDTTHTIKNNIVFQNGTNFLMKVSKHEDNIVADPQFVNYIRTGGGDYHLKKKSPAIDKGISTLAPSMDYDGKVRPKRKGYDIGAFEY